RSGNAAARWGHRALPSTTQATERYHYSRLPDAIEFGSCVGVAIGKPKGHVSGVGGHERGPGMRQAQVGSRFDGERRTRLRIDFDGELKIGDGRDDSQAFVPLGQIYQVV